MTTLVDLNQVIYKNFFASVGRHTNIKVDVQPMRSLIINTIRYTNKLFKYKYGNMVLALDSRSSWRKDVFPHYKAHRISERNNSDVDWDGIHAAIDIVKHEVAENFPYRFMEIDGCEADDIIAVLVQEYSRYEPTVIVSQDKDFRQLQRYPNVSQYDPIGGEYMIEDDPEQYLQEHIVSGDRSDGIPNIICPDDYFVRESPIVRLTKKRRTALAGIENRPTDEFHQNWKRNKQLIDFSEIPEKYKDVIIHKYEEGPKIETRANIYKYLVDNNLGDCLRYINDF